MSQELRTRLCNELSSLVLVDPHTHINALDPASRTPADILGYHYYTELAHSAGMPKDQIEEPGLDPKEKVGRLMENLGAIDNSIQYSWFVEMAQTFFGFDGDRITKENWEPIYDCAVREMSADDWPDTVLMLSKLEAVFLTNDFDDPLSGFDTKTYIPCLRTDDLVFHLSKRDVQERLTKASGVAVGDSGTLKYAIGKLFEHFSSNNARACAISLPPDFAPTQISEGRANTAITSLYALGPDASDADKKAVANFVFWTLAEYCNDFRLPFDLMIGVNRGVYEAGVYQGQDLYDSRVSLIQYKELFNAFPNVTFPISVLASVTNQELTSYAWIFPNVVTNGHWWYSNTPTYIEHDAAARLEAVPRTKQIGYYSDMYKLEFALPKFNMYKRILAKILAERYVIDRGWTEECAVDFGKQVLRGNVETIFRLNEEPVIHAVTPPARPQVPATAPFLQQADEPSFEQPEPADSSFAPMLEEAPQPVAAEQLAGAPTDDIFSQELPPPDQVATDAPQPAAAEFMLPNATHPQEDVVLDLPDTPDESASSIEPQPMAAPVEQPSEATSEPIQVPLMPSPDDNSEIDDIFGDDQIVPPGGAQIGAVPIEAPIDFDLPAPTDVPKVAVEPPNLEPQPMPAAAQPVEQPFPGVPMAEAPQPVAPMPAEPAAPAEDDLSIDDILDDEFAPPGFAPTAPQPTAQPQPAAPPQPQPVPVIQTPEPETTEDAAMEEAPEEQPFDLDLSPPAIETGDELQIDTAPVDDDEFPGIQI